jgi:chorismate mutase
VSAIYCRGVRGAISVDENSSEAILAAARELLLALVEATGIEPDDVGSLHFTTTVNLNAEYPALAVRQMGWTDVAILCGHEMDVPHGLPRCLRVLIMWNTTHSAHEIQHIYLRDAVVLRPDRAVHSAV